jgi:hypothetical protein
MNETSTLNHQWDAKHFDSLAALKKQNTKSDDHIFEFITGRSLPVES